MPVLPVMLVHRSVGTFVKAREARDAARDGGADGQTSQKQDE